MSTEPLRYFLELGGRLHPVRDVSGIEGISRPFRFEIRFHAEEGDPLEPEDLVKSKASLRLVRKEDERVIDGLVTDISIGAVIRGAPLVEVVLEPRLALARLRTDIRHFRDKTALQIVSEVLSGLGIRHELWLRETYEVRPYTVQHRESDFDFVSRLLEDEGVFYYFAPGDLLIIGDGPAAYESIGGNPVLPFRAGSALDRNEDAIHALGEHARIGASQVTLRDFNPEKPSLNMTVSAAGPTPAGPEFYDYPGEYLKPASGERKCRLIAEAMACAARSYEGESNSARLVPGRKFSLADAPQGIEDGEYVVNTLTHRWHRDKTGFSVHFDARQSNVASRPPRVTQAPFLTNPVTAFVTGPPGADVHTDELGRVKIQFHWDRLSPRDDTASYWVPVLQDNTGHSVGIPRVGWEVLVHFLEGDPDRPVVLGRVYNAQDTVPVPLPARKTCSSLKSMSSPGRDGTNEIQFEDAAGSEYIWMHAEKDQNIVVAHDKVEHIMATESTVVRRDETINVGVDASLVAGRDITPTIDNDQTLLTQGNRKLEIATADNATVKGERTMTVGGTHFRRVKTSDLVTADVLDEKVGGVVLETFLKTNATEAGKAMTVTVGGAIVEVARMSKTEGATKGRVDAVGGVVFSKAGDVHQHRSDKTRTTTVGGSLKVEAAKELVLTGAEKIQLSSATGKLQATKGTLRLKVGETIVELKDGTVGITASSVIKLIVSTTNNQGSDVATQI
ncbi:type VI secretion system Vgr family protein [Polyangium sorediatum]|uniref:Type VI secretion system tip protein TssI/VgrG n=1 Tax=Polyangium sorediatum TaxID=889274 RepID=A0ABT6P9H5_9BACT|nr:type VI secretion system tip protein TssI/VgrG [Polyangium sorediatum]MDI1437280.1 type VI secretion system tip protein TssI/VgrG [Polyangium sorediatum]